MIHYNLTTLPNELSLLTCVFSWAGACVEGVVVVVVVVVLAAVAAGAGCDGVDAGAGFSSCCLGASGFFSVGVDADVLDPAADDVVFGLNDDVSLNLFCILSHLTLDTITTKKSFSLILYSSTFLSSAKILPIIRLISILDQ